jgi:hypothetical protein
MRLLIAALAGVLATAALAPAARAAPCPGDLDGDGVVTITEIITLVQTALNGCAGASCPGDLNGDQLVTIDEILKAVAAALLGCSPTPTPTPTPTAGPTITSCPYSFLDDTFSLGVSCGYSGAFSTNPMCSTDLRALVLSDPLDGNLVAVTISSDPLITFGAVASSATQAAIIAYFVGDGLTPQPLSGMIESTDDGTTLIITPDTVPPFNIGAVDCSFERYVGTFTRLAADQARRRAPRRSARFEALRAVIAGH